MRSFINCKINYKNPVKIAYSSYKKSGKISYPS